MKSALFKKRGLFLVLVFGTVVLFVGMVWLIATLVPLKWLGQAEPSATAVALRIENNCTYPVAYWKEHPEKLPSKVVVGNRVYQADEMEEALSELSPEVQATLEAQLLGAFLNILAGADQSLIRTTVFQAYDWLAQHPAGGALSNGEVEAGNRLSSVLLAYNLGQAGVAACSYTVSPSLTPSITPPIRTATTTLTPTVSQTMTSTSVTSTSSPTATPTPTSTQFFPIATVFVPTQTRAPTIEPTREPPAPTNTQAPPPVPTNTQAPPTNEPTATFTLPPQFTLPPPP